MSNSTRPRPEDDGPFGLRAVLPAFAGASAASRVADNVWLGVGGVRTYPSGIEFLLEVRSRDPGTAFWFHPRDKRGPWPLARVRVTLPDGSSVTSGRLDDTAGLTLQNVSGVRGNWTLRCWLYPRPSPGALRIELLVDGKGALGGVSLDLRAVLATTADVVVLGDSHAEVVPSRPPEHVLASMVGPSALLVQDWDFAAVVGAFRAYPDGLVLSLVARWTRPQLRLDPGSAAQHGNFTLHVDAPIHDATAGHSPLGLRMLYGHAGAFLDLEYWLSPLPPHGPIRFRFESSAAGLHGQGAVDGGELAELAQQAIEL